MKISTFFDLYEPFHEAKDPGQITLGLREIGVNSDVITVAKPELEKYSPKFPLYQGQLTEFIDPAFWTKNDSDAILGYPLQGKFYSPVIEKMKQNNKKVILKLDSDGKIAYPLKRDYFMVPIKERLTIRNVVGDLWWHLASHSIKRRRHATFAGEVIKCFEVSDGVVIESPDALSNLNYFLTAWGRADLIKKTHFIPNPVRPLFLESTIGRKESVAVSFGRWDDFRQKNTQVMAECVVMFLEKRPDFRFIIFGRGIDTVKQLLESAPEEVRARIDFRSFVEDSELPNILSTAKMIFVPSRWESFNISSAESLCMGCSTVGTPLESLRYLSMQGFSGTTAATFDKEAILAALLLDAKKWDNGDYEPQKIAAFWRPNLDRRTVAKEIESLVEEC
jgi:glycosyltransferase involved in cell wall biosynthesis